MRIRAPRHPALRPLVHRLWASLPRASARGREWVLPTGTTHLALRLDDLPLRVFEEGTSGAAVGTAVLGGPRDHPYLRALEPVASVGAQLRPGAAPLLLGLPADEVAGRHLPLTELWGREVELLRERLAEAPWEQRLDLLEDFLLHRLRPEALDPVVRFSLEFFRSSADVGAAARATGYSHRHFIERFRRGVGLLPSTHLRILRFQRALELHARGASGGWAEVAHAVGYADQAHLSREFRRLAGMTPTVYAQRSRAHPNHVAAG